MLKKVKNDENRSDIDERGENWWEIRKILFLDFFQKHIEKCRKNWKMMKMGQILIKKVKIDEKWKKKNIFSIFSEKYGKMSKKVKNDENGSDID